MSLTEVNHGNLEQIVADLRAEVSRLQKENFEQSVLIHSLRLENEGLEACCEEMEAELDQRQCEKYFRDWPEEGDDE